MIRALLFVIALVSGGGALWFYLQREPSPPAIEEVAEPAPGEEAEPLPEVEFEMVSVLTVRRDFAAGERLTAEELEWIEWPQDFVLADFIRQDAHPDATENFAGWILREPHDVHEPLSRYMLREPDHNPLSELLSAGMRAIAVRVTIESTAGGFIVPGDRVDVIHTFTRAGAGAAESRIIASNVRVIALDQTTQRNEDQTILVERTATIELDRDQVARVSAAEQTGNLSLALRARADEEEQPYYPPPSVRIRRGGE